MNLTELITHPGLLDRETLYDLRSLIALHPYYQTARLLMLQNLYILHDPAFDEELRRAAVYITDRTVLFRLTEARHYQLRPEPKPARRTDAAGAGGDKETMGDGGSRTAELIDDFLGTLPQDEERKKPKARKPTIADAAVDYVAYMLDAESADGTAPEPAADAPQMKGQSLIDEFISHEGNGRIILPDISGSDDGPEIGGSEGGSTPEPIPDELYTETMAQIYIRQGKYRQAQEIIRRLEKDNPGKNAYFADQIRFLEKLMVNSSHRQ